MPLGCSAGNRLSGFQPSRVGVTLVKFGNKMFSHRRPFSFVSFRPPHRDEVASHVPLYGFYTRGGIRCCLKPYFLLLFCRLSPPSRVSTVGNFWEVVSFHPFKSLPISFVIYSFDKTQLFVPFYEIPQVLQSDHSLPCFWKHPMETSDPKIPDVVSLFLWFIIHEGGKIR